MTLSGEPLEIRVTGEQVADLRERLERTRWPRQPGEGWELGADLAYARELCEHWRRDYDFARLERLNRLGSHRAGGLHFLHLEAATAEPSGRPVVLLHGWPSGPIEYERAAQLLAESGREVIVPSLPGYAWSEDPGETLDVEGVAARLRELIEEGLGHEHYAVAGGDWGAIVAARIAFDAPESVVALHVTTPHTLPVPGDLGHPPLSEAEAAWVERARRWRRRRGWHLALQGTAPDAISPALTDSPAGLAAYLLGRYRGWSDSGGDVERRFSKDDLCDFLTMFWTTGSIASSMRLYWGEGRDRWRLGPEERIDAPAGAALFPGEMAGEGDDPRLNPPREWTERILPGLRRWTEMPAGGHFAAFEEPEAYANELIAFLDQIQA
ncbi:MAG TPA: epoxide hydrolase [Solirubrobacterales bacterium]|nr:epoxide hydrolase [Solirubrobacterales bacterium]